MSHLRNCILNAAYLAILIVCSPLVLYAAVRTGKYREGFAQKLLGLMPRRAGDRPCIWLHAVSVGEVNLIATMLSELQQRHPDWEIVLSTTTKTGHDLARRKYADYTVFYCPLDFSWAVRRAMRRIRPTMLVLAELELWPNLIFAAKEQGAKVAIVNGRLSDNSFRGYCRFQWLVKPIMRQVDCIVAQNDVTAKRFLALGAEPASVRATGSLKFDGAETNRHNPRTRALRELAGIARDDVVWLAGSTQEPEEQIAIAIYRRLAERYPQLRLIIVPRHPERFGEVAAMLDASGVEWQFRSELDCKLQNENCKLQIEEAAREPRRPRPRRILLVDTVGELGAWWGAATIGFVGGTFGSRGGQNMIEPAAYGVATAFGPNTWNFRDIVAALLATDGAVVVNDERELEQFVEHCLSDPTFTASLGLRARKFVATQLGATARTVDLIDRALQAQTAVAAPQAA
ncbi:MAG: 3-deoxy-D-manno-octulosonic acid transferase [Pirellulales bacterium]